MKNEKNDYEIYFSWWLEELKKLGLVIEYEFEPKTFIIDNPVVLWMNHKYKTKKHLVKDITLFQPLTYTPDFMVLFDKRMANNLFALIDYEKSFILDDDKQSSGNIYQNTLFFTMADALRMRSGNEVYELWFDVKPNSKAIQHSGQLSSSRDFRYLQRAMYHKHKILVNKVVPIKSSQSLFNKTFVPQRYLYTDGGTKVRVIDETMKYRTSKDYLLTKGINLDIS